MYLQGLFSRITFREPVFLGGTGNITGLAKRLPVADGMVGCIRKFVANEHEYIYAAQPLGDIAQGFDVRKYRQKASLFHSVLFDFQRSAHATQSMFIKFYVPFSVANATGKTRITRSVFIPSESNAFCAPFCSELFRERASSIELTMSIG